MSVDILTDVMSESNILLDGRGELTPSVISLPVSLLWNARIKTRQKYGLLVSLCLSIFMIVVSSIRATTTPGPNVRQDVPFELFLLLLEGCVAVLMASVSAFHPLFAAEGSRASRKKPNMVWTTHPKFWNRGKRTLGSDFDTVTNGLPSIPSATMTGLHTLINGGARQTTLRSDFGEASDNWPLTLKRPETLHARSASAAEEV